MANDKVSASNVLLPVLLLSTAVLGFFAFQTTLLVSDHKSLLQTFTEQQKALEQVAKLKTQVNSLAVGTLKLAEKGDKDAANIIAQLKKAGVNVEDTPPAAAPPETMTPTTGKAQMP
jgi:hypothetical protein